MCLGSLVFYTVCGNRLLTVFGAREHRGRNNIITGNKHGYKCAKRNPSGTGETSGIWAICLRSCCNNGGGKDICG